MGRFTYNETTRAAFDDRTLRHVQAVIGAKLRRGESFFFSWRSQLTAEGDRVSIWIHPGASLVFTFYGSTEATLNRSWVDALTQTANTANGLRIVPELDHPAAPGARDRSA